MTPPRRYLVRMLLFLVAVLAVCGVLHERLLPALLTNPVLNALILVVAIIGVVWNLRQVLLLQPEVAWLVHFRAPREGAPAQPLPRLLGPMASMFATAMLNSHGLARRRAAMCCT